MRLGSRKQFFVGLIFLVLFAVFFCAAGHAATDGKPLFTSQKMPYSCMTGYVATDWRNIDSESVILGQNRYTRYLKSYGLWGNLYGYEGRLRPRSSVFDKLRNSDTGMQVGVDLPTGGMFSTCFYYSYAKPTFSVQSSPFLFLDSAELKSTNHLFGLRWCSYDEGLYMLFGLNGGFDNYDFDLTSHDKFKGSGWQMGGNGEFGLDVNLSEWRLRPHLTFDYRWLQHGAIDNSLAPLITEDTYNALYSNLGLRVFRPLGPILDWQTRFSWLHNYLGGDDPIRIQRFGSISGLTTPTQMFLDGNLGRDWLWFGTGMKLHFGSFFSFFVDYDLTFNKYETTHCGSIMVLLSW